MSGTPSKQYTARANAFAEAVRLGEEALASLPARERKALIAHGRQLAAMAASPRPGFASMRSLAYLEEAFFTYWNESSGPHVEAFWRSLAAQQSPFSRRDRLREILKRGRIASRADYELAVDSMVGARQEGRISAEEEQKLGEMIGRYETKPRRRAK